MRMLMVAALAAVACGEVHPSNPDAITPDGCSPETDSAFCMRLGKSCEPFMGTDNCGRPRTANCGTCAGGQACLSNACRAPLCTSFSFGPGMLVPDINNTAMVQDALAGVTPSGSTILYQRGNVCGPTYQLFIADETMPGRYGSMELTAVATLAGMRVRTEEALEVTADGLTIIGVTSDGKGLLKSTRTAAGRSDFAVASGTDFAALTLPAGPRQLSSPILSADGLALYYQVSGDPDAMINGIYESVRASTSVPFAAGTRMPAPVQDYQNPTGISSDRLALFVQNNMFAVFVLTRLSLSAPFTNPNAPSPPPTVPGWRTRPLATCMRLIGTSNGGCLNEDTFFFSR